MAFLKELAQLVGLWALAGSLVLCGTFGALLCIAAFRDFMDHRSLRQGSLKIAEQEIIRLRYMLADCEQAARNRAAATPCAQKCNKPAGQN